MRNYKVTAFVIGVRCVQVVNLPGEAMMLAEAFSRVWKGCLQGVSIHSCGRCLMGQEIVTIKELCSSED
jgi:hypothetical protein